MTGNLIMKSESIIISSSYLTIETVIGLADPGFRVPVFFQTQKTRFLDGPKPGISGLLVAIAQNIIHLGARVEREAQRSRIV